MHTEGRISIWFFIGSPLLAYGVLILGSGIYEWAKPAPQAVLANLHAAVWWGALLLVLRAVYCVRFFPHKSSSDS